MKLGKHSLNELQGVDNRLVAIVRGAIEITQQDFTVHDGIRTPAEQEVFFKKGVSKTLDSKHLTGHAVDLVPYVNGKLLWEWPLIYMVADAMRTVAKEQNVAIRWGGAWDINLTDSSLPLDVLVSQYVTRRKEAGKKAFIDGPHYELINI